MIRMFKNNMVAQELAHYHHQKIGEQFFCDFFYDSPLAFMGHISIIIGASFSLSFLYKSKNEISKTSILKITIDSRGELSLYASNNIQAGSLISNTDLTIKDVYNIIEKVDFNGHSDVFINQRLKSLMPQFVELTDLLLISTTNTEYYIPRIMEIFDFEAHILDEQRELQLRTISRP